MNYEKTTTVTPEQTRVPIGETTTTDGADNGRPSGMIKRATTKVNRKIGYSQRSPAELKITDKTETEISIAGRRLWIVQVPPAK